MNGPMTGETIKVRNVTNPKYNSNVNNIRYYNKFQSSLVELTQIYLNKVSDY